MQTRTRKIWRDLLTRRGRTLLVSMSIFIGVFGTITLISMGDILVNKLEADLKEEELAMVRVFVDVKADRERQSATDSQAVVASLSTLVPDATAVEGLAVYPISWKTTNTDDFTDGNVFAYTSPFGTIPLEPPKRTEGDFPREGMNELAIEQRMAREYDLEVGDKIVVRVLSAVEIGQPLTEIEETWTISGILFQAYQYQNALNVADYKTMVFATYPDAQKLANFEGLSNIYVRFTDFATAERNLQTLQGSILLGTPYTITGAVVEDPAENSFLLTVDTTRRVINLLAVVSLVVSGFLVFNVINATVVEQQRQIGVMKSLGATREDNMLIYLGMAFGYGLIGIIPGVLLGIPSGFIAAQGLGEQLSTIIEDFAVSPRAILFGITVGLVMPMAAAFIPVYNGTRITIREAMTDLGISTNYGQGPLVRLINRLPVPISVKQGIAGLGRKRGRTIFTMMTVAVASGSFMGVYAVFSSLNGVLQQFSDVYNFQFYMIPHQLIGDPPSEASYAALTEEIEANTPEIEAGGPLMFIVVEIQGYTLEINATTEPPALYALGTEPAQDAYLLTLQEGEGWEQDPNRRGVVINHTLANGLHKGVGVTINLRTGGGEYQAIEIIGIMEFPFKVIWIRWQDLAEIAGFVDDSGAPYPNAMLFNLKGEEHTADEVADVIKEVNTLLLGKGITATYTNVPLFVDSNTQELNALQAIFNISAGLIAAVGMIGLLSTLSMAVFERQREIGVMRSVGANSLTIALQFVTEGVVIGLVAWVIGIPISYGLSELLIQALDFGEGYQLAYPPITVVIGLVGTVILAIVASVSPAMGAARRTVSAILRYQ